MQVEQLTMTGTKTGTVTKIAQLLLDQQSWEVQRVVEASLQWVHLGHWRQEMETQLI